MSILALKILPLAVLILCAANAVIASVHGGTFLAMAGKDCLVLLSDSRFSSQKTGSILLGKHPRPTIRIGSKCLVGCFGLENDARILLHKLRGKFRDHEEASIGPNSVARVVSDILYNNNLVLSPIVAGLGPNSEPYICTMDGLGAQTVSRKFAVVGTGSEGLLALCESLYTPGLDTGALVGLAEHCFHQAMQRDVSSGCDVRVLTITEGAIYQKDIAKMDT